MITYGENAKDSTKKKKKLELITNSVNCRIQTNMQKSVAFLNANNKLRNKDNN